MDVQIHGVRPDRRDRQQRTPGNSGGVHVISDVPPDIRGRVVRIRQAIEVGRRIGGGAVETHMAGIALGDERGPHAVDQRAPAADPDIVGAGLHELGRIPGPWATVADRHGGVNRPARRAAVGRGSGIGRDQPVVGAALIALEFRNPDRVRGTAARDANANITGGGRPERVGVPQDPPRCFARDPRRPGSVVRRTVHFVGQRPTGVLVEVDPRLGHVAQHAEIDRQGLGQVRVRCSPGARAVAAKLVTHVAPSVECRPARRRRIGAGLPGVVHEQGRRRVVQPILPEVMPARRAPVGLIGNEAALVEIHRLDRHVGIGVAHEHPVMVRRAAADGEVVRPEPAEQAVAVTAKPVEVAPLKEDLARVADEKRGALVNLHVAEQHPPAGMQVRRGAATRVPAAVDNPQVVMPAQPDHRVHADRIQRVAIDHQARHLDCVAAVVDHELRVEPVHGAQNGGVAARAQEPEFVSDSQHLADLIRAGREIDGRPPHGIGRRQRALDRRRVVRDAVAHGAAGFDIEGRRRPRQAVVDREG